MGLKGLEFRLKSGDKKTPAWQYQVVWQRLFQNGVYTTNQQFAFRYS